MENFGVTLAHGYNAVFAVASAGMVVSLLIFTIFRKYYSEADYRSKVKPNIEKDADLTPKQEKERVVALLTIFAIEIFFWMAFIRMELLYLCLQGIIRPARYTNLHTFCLML